MVGTSVRRFLCIYRDSYRQERARREAGELERPWTTARRGFWLTLGLAYFLNLLKVVVDLGGPVWNALTYLVGIAWIMFAALRLVEVLASRKARKAAE